MSSGPISPPAPPHKRSITQTLAPPVVGKIPLQKSSAKRASLRQTVPGGLPEQKLPVLIVGQGDLPSAMLGIVRGDQPICLLESLAPPAHEVGDSDKGGLVTGSFGLSAVDQQDAADLSGGKDGLVAGYGENALSAKDLVV